jgi:hypothetical protein
VKHTVRWRFVSESDTFTCWAVNGERIIVSDPKLARRNTKSLDDRVVAILGLNKRKRRNTTRGPAS